MRRPTTSTNDGWLESRILTFSSDSAARSMVRLWSGRDDAAAVGEISCLKPSPVLAPASAWMIARRASNVACAFPSSVPCLMTSRSILSTSNSAPPDLMSARFLDDLTAMARRSSEAPASLPNVGGFRSRRASRSEVATWRPASAINAPSPVAPSNSEFLTAESSPLPAPSAPTDSTTSSVASPSTPINRYVTTMGGSASTRTSETSASERLFSKMYSRQTFSCTSLTSRSPLRILPDTRHSIMAPPSAPIPQFWAMKVVSSRTVGSFLGLAWMWLYVMGLVFKGWGKNSS
mmetsp:Transcript_12125/g.24631  ORF Transcript_12125/g.24631 Transcript_12125/m.24631 type:complete len:291 (-) Transcript_12125:711-1583(-)